MLSDETGQASTFVTVLSTGALTITSAQLAPGSDPSPHQVQTTVVGKSSSLDIALAPQMTSIMQGATVT